MRKPLLLAAAVLLFAFYNYALVQWLQSGHTFGDIWRAVRSDWLLAVTVLDMSLFSLLCLVWLYRDMLRRGWPAGRRTLVMLTALLTGVVVLLAYLALVPAGPVGTQQKRRPHV